MTITIVTDEQGIIRCIGCNEVEDVIIENMELHLADFHGWERIRP